MSEREQELIEYIHELGAMADVCVYRTTKRKCIGCKCPRFAHPTPSEADHE